MLSLTFGWIWATAPKWPHLHLPTRAGNKTYNFLTESVGNGFYNKSIAWIRVKESSSKASSRQPGGKVLITLKENKQSLAL